MIKFPELHSMKWNESSSACRKSHAEVFLCLLNLSSSKRVFIRFILQISKQYINILIGTDQFR